MSFLPDLLIAVIATWLGATVVARAPRYYVARVFGLAMALATLWSGSRVVAHLTNADEVVRFLVAVEAGMAALAPAVLLHFALAYCHSGRWSRAQRLTLGIAYGAGLVVTLRGLIDRASPLSLQNPHPLLGVPGALVIWGWSALRAALLVATLWWAWRAWRAATDGVRRERLTILLLALGMASLGILATIVARQFGGPEWFGTTALAISLGLATYAVAAGHVFRTPAAARRSFAASLGTGLLTALYVGFLLVIDRLARVALGTDAPLVTTFALILTIALFDPVRERLRALLGRRADRREAQYRRLSRALGGELLAAQRPQDAIGPALAQICETIGIGAAAIRDETGTVIATFGPQAALAAGPTLSLRLTSGERAYGHAHFGAKHGQLPYRREETDLLRDAAAFVAASLQLAARQTEQAAALEALVQEREALTAHETTLAAALEVTPTASPAGLAVHALGPLRVELDGTPIRQWGGAKAGSRQAVAIFAFLFDRGERGVTKDEFLELIWPDVPLDKADLAFHRTLGGLRRALEPGLARAGAGKVIAFGHDRYRLAQAAVVWRDVAIFEERLAAAGAAHDPADVRAALEEARALYRGDYLDDCPYYGDSEFVEERRQLLRARYVDLLLALGERREAAGDTAGAASCYRDALRVADDDCPRADAALTRLGLAT